MSGCGPARSRDQHTGHIGVKGGTPGKPWCLDAARPRRNVSHLATAVTGQVVGRPENNRAFRGGIANALHAENWEMRPFRGHGGRALQDGI